MRWSWLLAPCLLLLACADDPAPPTAVTDIARTHAREHAAALGVSPDRMPVLEPLGEVRVLGGTVTRLQQVIEGMPVYRHELRTLVDDRGRVVRASGRLFELGMRRSSPRLVDDEAGAIRRAVRHTHGPIKVVRVDEARARRFWYPHAGSLVAAWVVEAYTSDPQSTDHQLHRTVIDGAGRVLAHDSLVSDAGFSYRVFADPTTKLPHDGPIADATPHPTGTPGTFFPAYIPPSLVSVTSLSALGDPWLPVDATETVGNNVDAYADVAAPSGLGSGDFRAVKNGSGFDYVYDTSQGPLVSTTQQMAAITSLFYVVNWLHDFWYDAGFTETAGNAQAQNYGRGGIEGDVLLAEAQDNAYGGSRNNANMMTPDDGLSPRMQVFLWSGRDTRTASLQPSGRTPRIGGAVFGPRNFSFTGDVIVGEDGMGVNPTDGCTPYTNHVAGKIVLVDRGNCTFKTKTLNAQNAGALGVIIANNVVATNPPSLGDDANLTDTITIPSVSVTMDEGATIKQELLAGPVTATLYRQVAPELDGSLDSTLIAHEFGHYLHHRLSFCTNTMCRALSEGWGDFTALMLLAREGDDLDGAFPFSIYTTQSYAGDPAYFGIRRAPYSVDFAKNALSFRHMGDREALPTDHPFMPSGVNSQVHNAGEIWASALWEVYVALQRAGSSFSEVRAKMARYVVAGLLLAPVDASPTQTRDAILAAALAASPEDHQVMIEAFARRGFGSCAVSPPQGSVDFVGIVESSIVAGNPQLGTLAVDDGCDDDGVLDTGETARMKIRIVNQGHAPLTDLTFTLTSDLPAVSMPSPVTTRARLEPFETVDLEFEVSLAEGMADAIAGDLALEVTANGACESSIRIPVATRLNIDDVPARSATDTFDTDISPWTPWTIAWSQVRKTPLDGMWHGDALSVRSDTSLVSPPLTAEAARPLILTFSHRYQFEMANGIAWDGGVIEYSLDDGATWEDVASLTATGYNGAIGGEASNPLADRAAYVATSAQWPELETVTISLGTTLAGQTFRLRFRIGTDSGTGTHGWDIDDVALTGIVGTPFPVQIADDGNCDPVVPADDPILSGGGGCCESGRSSSGVFALFVVVALLRRRRS